MGCGIACFGRKLENLGFGFGWRGLLTPFENLGFEFLTQGPRMATQFDR